MSTQSLDSDIYDYGFILNSTALHEAAMSVLVTTIYGRWRGTTTPLPPAPPQDSDLARVQLTNVVRFSCQSTNLEWPQKSPFTE